MKKRILAMIFVLALCFCTVIPAFAVDADGFVSEYERVQDMAQLLSESERAALIKTLDELSERQKMDVIVVTTKTLDGKSPWNMPTISMIIANTATEKKETVCCSSSAWRTATGGYPPAVTA